LRFVEKPSEFSPVAILGAGLGGLVTAFTLERAGIPYDLFEAAPATVGGIIQSERIGPYLLDYGPNSLQLSPALVALIEAAGLTDQLVETAAVSQHRYVLRDGQLRRLPGSPPALLASGYFSWGTKLRLLTELFRRPGRPIPADTTLAGFFRERFGEEVVRWALDPFVAGVWAGDPEKLLVHETMPRLAALATEHGSLIRGLMKAAGGTGRRKIISFRDGAAQLPAALAAPLRRFHQGAAVTAVQRRSDGAFALTFADGRSAPSATYRHIVLALPTYAAAPVLGGAFPEFAQALTQVRYPAMAATYLAYPRAAVGQPLDGFGALYPRAEGKLTAGSIWSSSIYPARCPADQVLITSFVGGDQSPTAADQPDETLLTAVDAELRALYGISAPPVFRHLARWPRAIPQLDAAIQPVRAALPALEAQGVWAVANWAAGVGVPDVVARAVEIANRLA
jgi:protoporphyrinogen/coproporphyrinogen III oxidase